MAKRILALAAMVLLEGSIAFAQMHHKQMLEFISACEKLAGECSIGDKTSCIKLKKHARIMRNQIVQMAAAERGQMYDGDVIEEIQKSNPQMAKHLADLKSKNPSGFKRVVKINRESNMCIKPQMIEPDNEDTVNILGLNLKEQEIREKYKLAKSGEEKDSIKKELKQVLSEKYDIKTEYIKKKINNAQDRVDIHKENLKSRKRNKKDILKRQADLLLK